MSEGKNQTAFDELLTQARQAAKELIAEGIPASVSIVIHLSSRTPKGAVTITPLASQVEDYLREHGPGSVAELAKALGVKSDTVRVTLHRHVELFAKIAGTGIGGRGLRGLWGRRGVTEGCDGHTLPARDGD